MNRDKQTWHSVAQGRKRISVACLYCRSEFSYLFYIFACLYSSKGYIDVHILQRSVSGVTASVRSAVDVKEKVYLANIVLREFITVMVLPHDSPFLIHIYLSAGQGQEGDSSGSGGHSHSASTSSA